MSRNLRLRFITGKKRKCYLVNQLDQFHIIMYMYKGKDPVFYAFTNTHPCKPICNSLKITGIENLATSILLKYGNTITTTEKITTHKRKRKR